MYNITRNIITWLCLSTLLWSVTSCSNESRMHDELPSPADEVSLSIGFRVPTRAPGNYLYEEGSTYENYIDIAGEGYRIYFFDTDNKYIARFEPSGFFPKEGTDYIDYYVLGEAPKAFVTKSSFKVVVIANWQQYPDDTEMKVGVTTIDDVCKGEVAQYNQFTSFNLNEDNLIPFYGVHEYSNITFSPEFATILPETIKLLRAVAKVEVILETDATYNLSFKNVRINRYNKKGYCAPQNIYAQGSYDHNGVWADDYVHTLHIVNGRNDVDDTDKVEEKTLDFICADTWEANGSKYQKWIAYLTEYQNKDVNDGYCFVEAKFTHQYATDVYHKIYFAEYSSGVTDNANTVRLNVERNNIYRFHVVSTPLQLLVSVDAWEYGGKVHIEM